MNHQFALRGRIVTADSVIDDGVIRVDHGVIASIVDVDSHELSDQEREQLRELPRSAGTFLPGLVDVHCHGGGGASFANFSTLDEARRVTAEHMAHGTTTLVASLVTAPIDDLVSRAKTLAELADEGTIAGIHFEGPFISPHRCGAQDPAYVCAPDVEQTRQLLAAARGHAVSMTLAPEVPGAYGGGSVVEELVRSGVVPSWGHTDASDHHARAAMDFAQQMREQCADSRGGGRGVASTVTHLFNGMRPLHQRDPGPIAEFLSDAARGGVMCEMICDGIHVKPSLVRDVYEIVGRDHCVFITDATAAAGMPDGSYVLGTVSVTVENGVARLTRGGTMAGGTSHLLECVRTAVEKAGIPLVDAVFMASMQGARILGSASIGALEAGRAADIVCVAHDWSVEGVWKNGKAVA
ncbi:amidohydrolase family protein [Schaalia sp. ZJ405]|uniref:N-acetylglucosamine-6-phosphate deacetylase n=1 Tax=Schaalia sp. ZJ405 TaxID=2709403 RepID=UPI0013EBF0E6|nr:amidohydrolase family protein [Schaalia sp. ZJ405]QPK80612.1 amidohydrolase family protein [Schaalia sp. ZJ405]